MKNISMIFSVVALIASTSLHAEDVGVEVKEVEKQVVNLDNSQLLAFKKQKHSFKEIEVLTEKQMKDVKGGNCGLQGARPNSPFYGPCAF